MKRLLAIALLVFLQAEMAAAAGDIHHARGIVGILPLPEVFGAEPCEHFKTSDIELFRAPDSTASMGRIFVSKPWTFPPSGGCEGLEVSVSIAEPSQRNELLPTLEFSYENPGAIVTERQGEWFKIALSEGTAWVRVSDGGARYLPVEQLLEDSLSYLHGQGPSGLLKSPERGETAWSRGTKTPTDLPVEVLAFREVTGRLWAQVRLLAVEPCTEESTHVVPVTGWLPFHDPSGMPSIWFYSRGC